MQKNSNNKLSNWTLWLPLRFAFRTLFLAFIGLVFAILIVNIFDPTIRATNLISTGLPTLGVLISIYLMLRNTPHDNINHESFVAIHNAQSFLLSSVLLAFILVTAPLMTISPIFVQSHLILTTFILVMILLISLYIGGLGYLNLYAKYRRIRTLNVPIWKICLSIPFGFSLLWIPGYIIPDATKKSDKTISQPAWYKRITDWVIANPLHLAIGFVVLTLCSLYIDIKPILLTFIMALICGIWAIQSGTKKFIKKIGGKYSTFAIIINIVTILTVLIFSTMIMQHTPDAQPGFQESIEITMQ